MNKQYDLTSPTLLIAVMDKIDTPTALVDVSGNVSFVNASLARRLPTAVKGLIGTPFVDISEGVETGPFKRSHCVITIGPQPLNGMLQPLFDEQDSWIGQVFFALPPFMQSWTNLDLLQDREMRWETAFECADQAVWEVWNSKNERFVSDNWFQLRGINRENGQEVQKNWQSHIHPDDLAGVQDAIHAHDIGATDIVDYNYRFQHGDGHWIWIHSRGRVVLRDQDGHPDRIIGTDSNITNIKRIETEHKAAAERLRLAMEVSKIGLWHYQLDQELVHWDDQMLAIYGIDDGQTVRPKEAWTDTIHPDDVDRVLHSARECVAAQTEFANDYRILRPDGEERVVRSRALFLTNHNNEGPSFLGVNIDITADVEKTAALEKARARLEFESRHDPLTGLANRRKLDETHAGFVAATMPENIAFVVLHIDLDRFKEINDTHGHAAGDTVLVHIARTITMIVGDAGLVARIGGDEFVVFIEGAPSYDYLNKMAHALIMAAKQPVIHHGETLTCGMSIGIAAHDPSQSNPNAAFVAADLALYQAKKDGRDCARHFEPYLQDAAISRRLLHRDIVTGIQTGEFFNVYQPQYCAKSRRIVGVETLVRWQSPTLGLLTPDQFLPAAEMGSLVNQIDAGVLQRALTDLADWDERGLHLDRVSVNVSASRLRDPVLEQEIESLNIPKGRLSFELLETAFLEAEETTLISNIEMFRRRGIDLEIDDFGSGHASILGFLKIAPSRLKIDRALIMPITHSKSQRKIVAAIVEIAKLSNAEVVAEGIETEEHAKIASAIGCDILQGFGLSRPLDRDALSALLQNHQ